MRWSSEMAFSMSEPSVRFTLFAVRKQPVPRAWSPGTLSCPARFASPVSTSSSERTFTIGDRIAGSA
jgi:hypothetical protein